VAIGNVAKVDGLAKASILDIDGIAVTAAVAPAAAYSVRLLGSALNVPTYTGACMRVRRDSDNVEADIGFDSNDEFGLTSPVSNATSGTYTDFADFIGHGGTPANGFVRFWYDQSGNSLDAPQATAGSQAKIYDSSTGIIEDGSVGNEKPALQFAQDGFTAITGSKSDILFHQAAGGLAMCVVNPTVNTTRLCVIAETNGTSSSKKGFVFAWDDRSGTGSNDYGYYSLTAGTGPTGAIIATNEASFVTGSQSLMAIEYDWDAGIYQYQDGSLLDSFVDVKTPATGDATNDLSIGSLAGNNTYGLAGTMQELILYNAHDANRTAFETNIANYYGITL
jgi:hypothetical protein